jgi:hypothetical protein
MTSLAWPSSLACRAIKYFRGLGSPRVRCSDRDRKILMAW